MPPASTAALVLLLLSPICATRRYEPDRGPSTSVRSVERVVELPLYSRPRRRREKRDAGIGAIGLGDAEDITYNVLIQVGNIETPVVLDTGSSDLWVISSACTTCSALFTDPNSAPTLYPQESLRPVGLDAVLNYGDSLTGTHAFGLVGADSAGVAGFVLQNQYFAAINNTNASVLETGSAGIFGLGFPANRYAIENVQSLLPKRSGTGFFGSRSFPALTSLPDFSRSPLQHAATAQPLDILSSFTTLGPLLARLALRNAQNTPQLAAPQFSVTLQRDTVDLGGDVGQLTLGGLPAGVSNASLAWAGVRRYTPAEGGLAGASGEVYPITWEVFLDDVYFDGEKLPRSTQGDSAKVRLSALLDTGNSLIRGPPDVVAAIFARLGANASAAAAGAAPYPCGAPHTLAFALGGRRFAVDPRDFGSPASGSAGACVPNLAPTDPPHAGGFLYSWSLGAPFLKGVLASFYYGNITHPSADAPRIGLLSTVPDDAGALLQAAVSAAMGSGGFPAVTESAPSGVFTPASTDAVGVGQARETLGAGAVPVPGRTSGASRRAARAGTWWAVGVAVLAGACAALS